LAENGSSLVRKAAKDSKRRQMRINTDSEKKRIHSTLSSNGWSQIPMLILLNQNNRLKATFKELKLQNPKRRINLSTNEGRNLRIHIRPLISMSSVRIKAKNRHLKQVKSGCLQKTLKSLLKTQIQV